MPQRHLFKSEITTEVYPRPFFIKVWSVLGVLEIHHLSPNLMGQNQHFNKILVCTPNFEKAGSGEFLQLF
jgi:hypothetical protein